MSTRRPINVAVSVLADISLGIYRTPANAFKELISNAFDADATRVNITTGFPFFKTMTCWDNGIGIESKEFEDIMERIGGSNKRKDGRSLTEMGRPIIGRIGIGILAVAQICKKFTIISSKKGSNFKFEAIVDISQFASEKAKEISLGSEKAEKIGIGSYEFFDGLPEDEDSHYTKIILEDIEPGFRERLLEDKGPELKVLNFKFNKKNTKTMSDFVDWVSKTDVRLISDYNKLIWELGIICPVPYIKGGPIKNHNIINEIKKRILDYDFKVKIDGINLEKPILFPTDKTLIKRPEDYDICTIDFDEIVNNERLSFAGYIYYQRKAIRPPELRGILVRLQNVAIGMYDKSLLNYPTAQGPKLAFISGEVFVDKGLEKALNVDRNSFRETDPHYLKLLEIIYTRLGGDQDKKITGIFTDITKHSKERNEIFRINQLIQIRNNFLSDIKTNLGESYEFEVATDNLPIDPIKIDSENKIIYIYKNHPIFPKAKGPRENLEKVLVSYELAAQHANTSEEIRKIFYHLLSMG